jgi:hypothetical protein
MGDRVDEIAPGGLEGSEGDGSWTQAQLREIGDFCRQCLAKLA